MDLKIQRLMFNKPEMEALNDFSSNENVDQDGDLMTVQSYIREQNALLRQKDSEIERLK